MPSVLCHILEVLKNNHKADKGRLVQVCIFAFVQMRGQIWFLKNEMIPAMEAEFREGNFIHRRAVLISAQEIMTAWYHEWCTLMHYI